MVTKEKRNTFGNKSNLNSKTYIIISKQFGTYKKNQILERICYSNLKLWAL